jgi:hypothetical protein
MREAAPKKLFSKAAPPLYCYKRLKKSKESRKGNSTHLLTIWASFRDEA